MKPTVVTKTYIEYCCEGFERPYQKTVEITKKCTPQDIEEWRRKLLNETDQDEARHYRTYQTSQTILELKNGEVLKGELKTKYSPYTILNGGIYEIPTEEKIEEKIIDYFNDLSIPEWRRKAEVHSLSLFRKEYKRQREAGYTHYTIIEGPYNWLWLKPNGLDAKGEQHRVFNRAGVQLWPLSAKPPNKSKKTKEIAFR